MRRASTAVLICTSAFSLFLGLCPAPSYAQEPDGNPVEVQEDVSSLSQQADAVEHEVVASGPEDAQAAQPVTDVAVETQGFSKAENGVATVGDITYDDVTAAFAALSTSEEAEVTLTLLQDASITATQNLGKSERDSKDNTTRIVNLNGHTLTYTGDKSAISVLSGTCQIVGGGTISGGLAVDRYACGTKEGATEKVMEPAVLELRDATVSNTEGSGWGVVIDHAVFIMRGGTITRCKSRGVYNWQGAFTMEGGTISNNADSGVKVQDATFTMTGGEIRENTAALLGGGVYLQGATFRMQGGTIAQNVGPVSGGGVYVGPVSSFTMSGGEIRSNMVTYAKVGHGGGVFVEVIDWDDKEKPPVKPGSTFVLQGGTIANNSAEEGGGIYVNAPLPYDYAIDPGAFVFSMTGGAVRDNVATEGNGGGVYLYEGNTQLSGGTVSGNEAKGLGGVYVDGRFCLGGPGATGVPVVVENNTGNAGGRSCKSNLYLCKDQRLQVTGLLAAGSAIGVSAQESTPNAQGVSERVITSGYKSAFGDVDPLQYFASDNDRYDMGWNASADVAGARTDAALRLKGVTYSAHQQTFGDLAAASNGEPVGVTGESKRLEAIRVTANEGSIRYRSHVQGLGWEQSWASDGEQSGTTGQSRRIEAIQMTYTVDGYSVWYAVHVQTYGWLGWAKDGDPAGTSGMSKRVESYKVMVLPRGETPPGYDATVPAYVAHITARAHVQGTGWTQAASTGVVGTVGKSKRLEAFGLSLSGLPYSGLIAYKSHVQGIGWQDGWASDGGLSGTTGQSKRIEAVRITLGGAAADHLSVWYRVHSQTLGWGNWVTDGDIAGTTGQSKRAEAIEVQLISKGAVPL
ncbi:MAG: hypothetical protein Q4A01_08680 [Coriobacteriales bacterium]|nr:hypothetical protein [Coriobacteriales bacterium]